MLFAEGKKNLTWMGRMDRIRKGNEMGCLGVLEPREVVARALVEGIGLLVQAQDEMWRAREAALTGDQAGAKASLAVADGLMEEVKMRGLIVTDLADRVVADDYITRLWVRWRGLVEGVKLVGQGIAVVAARRRTVHLAGQCWPN